MLLNKNRFTKWVIAASSIAALLFYGTAGAVKEDVLRVEIKKDGSAAIPKGWELKEWNGKADFEVVDFEGGSVIRLKSASTSAALSRDMEFDIKDYPVINWKWKISELPKGADVRESKKDDQAAQLYIIFPKWPAAVNSRVVGYIWDTSAPPGTTLTSTKTPTTKYIVIKGGLDGLGRWFAEKRNIYEDYKRLFNEDPPKVGKVSVMTDSDDTKSAAEAFMGDIFFSKD